MANKSKSHRPVSSQIPQEILVEILSRLPLKSLHRFKFTSKSWSPLITHQILPKIPPTPLGFFFSDISASLVARLQPSPAYTTSLQPAYAIATAFLRCSPSADASGDGNDIFRYIDPEDAHANIIDPTLSFMPCHSSEIRIRDCHNGLVLCNRMDSQEYFVCNPATKSWARLPGIDFHTMCRYMLLDFDPLVSPHYRVVAFQAHPPPADMRVYSSETRRWERKRVDGSKASLFASYGGNSNRTLWNGALYLYTRCGPPGAYCNFNVSPEGYRAIRFRISEEDVVHSEFIEFPAGTKKPRNAKCIARWGNVLGFAGLDGQRLRVWALRGECENEWVMEHDSIVCGINLSYRNEPPPHIVGFHPLRDAVLIFFKSVLYAYDLKEMSSDEICQIGSRAKEVDHATVFPFSACSFDLVENRNDH